jgi:hypothetical protein
MDFQFKLRLFIRITFNFTIKKVEENRETLEPNGLMD